MRGINLLVFCLLVVCTFCDTFTEISENERKEVEQVLEELESGGLQKGNPIDCEVCKLVVSTIEDLLQTNASVTIIDEIAFQICLQLEIPGWTPFVCHGTIREFGAEVIYVFTERFIDPEVICGALNFCSRSIDFSHSKIPRVDTTKTLAWQQMMSQTLRTMKMDQELPRTFNDSIGSFVHFSDIHYDGRYKVGANALCTRPQCCRESSSYPANETTQFRAAGQWGDYQCDTPLSLFDNMLQNFISQERQPDFMIYTGDNSAHDIWAQTQNMQEQRSVRIFERIQEKLPGLGLFPCLGNHESYPVDQFGSPPQMQWLYGALAKTWSPWLPQSALDLFNYGGYYTTMVTPGLRIISINTQYCDANDFWLLLDWQDPGGQIAWMNRTLEAAEAGNEKVWIIGHIPPNTGSCLDSYEEPLWSLIDRFHDTITALFFGHTHHDSFIVFKDFATNTKPIAIGYIAPSVTPYKNKNNAFRMVEYNRTSFEIVNFHQYILNLTDANEKGAPTWVKEYDPVSTYQMNSLSASEWLNVVNKFENNQTMLDLYHYYYYCSYGTMGSCTGGCKSDTICTLQASTAIIDNECTGNIPGPGLSTFLNHFCPSWWSP